MPDTSSQHVIKYILELDEEAIIQQAQEVGDRVSQRLGETSSGTASRGVGVRSGGIGEGSSTVKRPPRDDSAGETIGEAMAKRLGEKFQGAGAGKDASSYGAWTLVNMMSGMSNTMGRVAAMPGEVVKGFSTGGLAGGLAAGGPLIVAAAAAAAIYAMANAASKATEALGYFAQGMMSGNASSMIKGMGSSIGSAGWGIPFAAAALGGGPGLALSLPIAAAFIGLGAVVTRVTDLMDGLVQSLGQYNAITIAQSQVTDLMSRMLKIQIAGELQPAMSKWIELQQRIMGVMSNNPQIWETLNKVLIRAVEGVELLVKGFVSAYNVFAGVYNTLGPLVSPAVFALMGGDQLPYVDWKTDSTGLKQNALSFNRAFLDAMQSRGGGGPTGPGGAGGSAQRMGGSPFGAFNPASISMAASVNAQFNINDGKTLNDAVERLKDRLWRGLQVSRDETSLLVGLLDGYVARGL